MKSWSQIRQRSCKSFLLAWCKAVSSCGIQTWHDGRRKKRPRDALCDAGLACRRGEIVGVGHGGGHTKTKKQKKKKQNKNKNKKNEKVPDDTGVPPQARKKFVH